MQVFVATVVLLGLFGRAVSAFGQAVPESEPNDTPATADTAVLGGMASGKAPAWSQADSVDYWVVRAEGGDTIHVALDGCEWCGDGKFRLDLYAADGVTKLDVERDANGNDPQLWHVATTAGLYFVEVRFSADDASAPIYTLTFRKRDCPEDPGEPNETLANARSFPLGSVIEGMWCPGSDRDYFKVDVAAGTILEFSLSDYVRSDPVIHLFGPSGESLDSLITYDRGPGQFMVPTSGTYYVHPSTTQGGIHRPYRLSIRTAGQVPPGPGDPTIVRVNGGIPWLSGLAADSHGGFWLGTTHISLDGAITTFHPPDVEYTALQSAFDPWGNLLVLTPFHLVKFAPPERTVRLLSFAPLRAVMLAVTSDAIWIGARSLGQNALNKYTFDGHLLESHRIPASRLGALTIGPMGVPYIAADNAVYRLTGGELKVVLRHDDPSEISGVTFDTQGNVYVSDIARIWSSGWLLTVGRPRVSLYDSRGTVLADSFSWWPKAPRSPTFGRNADGTTNGRLFVLDWLDSFDIPRLVELNPAGVKAPGLSVAPLGTCPQEMGEREPNNQPANAASLVVGGTVVGVSCGAGDQDYFRIAPSRTLRAELEVHGADQPILELLAADGVTRLAFSDGALVPRPHVSYTLAAGRTYFVRVGSWFGGPTSYALHADTVSGSVALTRERAAREFVRSGSLTPEERSFLDRLGNNDGRYDIADFRALVQRGRAAPGTQP